VSVKGEGKNVTIHLHQLRPDFVTLLLSRSMQVDVESRGACDETKAAVDLRIAAGGVLFM